MVHRSSRGQFSALIAKSCIKQVGGAGIGELLCCSRLFSLRVWLALSTAASEVKVPIQPFCCCCCCDTISKHRSSTAPAAAKPRNVSAKLSPAAAAKSCHQQLQSCQAAVTQSPFRTSLHLPKNLLTPPLSTISHQAASPKPFPLKHLRRNNRIFDTMI